MLNSKKITIFAADINRNMDRIQDVYALEEQIYELVDGCDCEEILQLIKEGKIDTTPLITHRFPLTRIAEAYELFEQKRDGVIKVAITQ